ncbi:MAG: PIG-L family deacetylase [Candidatus Omnitrophica bacterium]|nr:PIG-L family deacetylase [Candidatus Omnitrophota bacterium]
MTRIKIILACCILYAAVGLSAHAEETLPEISSSDRILVFAPHPDDEAIGTAGVIQKALKAHAELRIVCYTNGEHNEPAFIVYEKRIVLKKNEFIRLGEVRRQETLKAMELLGVKKEQIFFLGYPDFGTMEILTKYWQSDKPYRSLLTRISTVPYKEAVGYKSPYVGESILRDIKTVIKDFKPTKIFVSHPGDTNRDHRALYVFTKIALWDMEGEIQSPHVIPYIIHVNGWPKPRGYHPDIYLDHPQTILGCGWQKEFLTEDEIKKKHSSIRMYKSQIECDPPYLFTFVRMNELFGDYPEITLHPGNEGTIAWEWLEPSNRIKSENSKNLDVGYACANDNLYIIFKSGRPGCRNLFATIFLLGYSYNREFSSMPKIQITVNSRGVYVKDKKEPLFVKEIKKFALDNACMLVVPLSALGRPDRIFSCVKTIRGNLIPDEHSWRILVLTQKSR